MSTLIIEFLVEINHVCINSFKHSNAKWCHRSGSIYRRRWSVTFALDIFNNKWIPSRWDRVAHICVSKLTIIDSDDGLSPGRRQAIFWTNAGILLMGHLGNSNRKSYFFFKKIHFKNVVWKMAAILSRPQCVKKRRQEQNGKYFVFVIKPVEYNKRAMNIESPIYHFCRK